MANEGLLTFDWPVNELVTFTADILKSDSSTRQSAIAFSDAGHLGRYKNTTSIPVIEAGDSIKLYLAGSWVSTEPYQPEVTVQNIQVLVNAVWDEVLTGATHNNPTSAGRRLRQLNSPILLDGVSPNTGGIANTSTRIELDSDASAISGTYDPGIISIYEGTGVGQSRQIFEYDGPNKFAYVNRDWKVIPDDTSKYLLVANSGNTHVNEGVAQGGGVNTIILNSLASSVDSVYIDQVVFIVAGTGADQAGAVIAYKGSSRMVTVEHPWAIEPDNTSVYAMLPNTNHSLNEITTAIKAMMGITEGGTWSWEKILKITTAFAAGNWRKKNDTTEELLDAEDKTTVILEQVITRLPAAGSNYRTITVKI